MTLKTFLDFNSTTQLTVDQSGLLYIITREGGESEENHTSRGSWDCEFCESQRLLMFSQRFAHQLYLIFRHVCLHVDTRAYVFIYMKHDHIIVFNIKAMGCEKLHNFVLQELIYKLLLICQVWKYARSGKLLQKSKKKKKKRKKKILGYTINQFINQL